LPWSPYNFIIYVYWQAEDLVYGYWQRI